AVSRAASNVEDVIDVDAPTGDGGLGVGHASAAEDDRRLAGAVGRGGLGERMDVPDDERAGLEIAGALGGVLPISARVIIVLIADLHRQGGRIWDVAHSVGRVWPVVVRSIGRERFTSGRQARDRVDELARVSAAPTARAGVLVQRKD